MHTSYLPALERTRARITFFGAVNATATSRANLTATPILRVEARKSCALGLVVRAKPIEWHYSIWNWRS